MTAVNVVVLAVVAATALFAPLITPYPYDAQDMASLYAAPPERQKSIIKDPDAIKRLTI